MLRKLFSSSLTGSESVDGSHSVLIEEVAPVERDTVAADSTLGTAPRRSGRRCRYSVALRLAPRMSPMRSGLSFRGAQRRGELTSRDAMLQRPEPRIPLPERQCERGDPALAMGTCGAC